ncbi:MAG: YceI family protein [Acidimicrobiaceae bacterium]|nr:YceI family protein [Acidimicrobiaceae bacterium]
MSNLPAPGVYNVDNVHSTVSFIARHLVASKVRGNFTDFSGVITIGDTPETSSLDATVQAASITTNNEMRDGHLKSADFLDLENHPTITLKSTKISAKSGDDYVLVGDLTLRGVTKSVTFDLEFLGAGPGMAPGVTVAGFEARADIDRRDFNVNFEGALENGSLVVGNKVTLELTIEAAKQD